jgi:hypothetical protein
MRSIFSRRERYERMKNNKEKYDLFKKKGKESRKRHYLKLKKEYPERLKNINIYQNKRIKELRVVAKEIGNCSRCFKEKDNPKWKMCSLCRGICRKYNYIYHTKKRNKKHGVLER